MAPPSRAKPAGLPTLKDLLDKTAPLSPLPAGSSPPKLDVAVTDTCGPKGLGVDRYLTGARRVMVSGGTVFLMKPDKFDPKANASHFRNPDGPQWAQVLSAKKDFRYAMGGSLTGALGGKTEGQLKFCRVPEPKEKDKRLPGGGAAVYVYETNHVLGNTCQRPNLLTPLLQMTGDEILSFATDRLDGTNYCVSPPYANGKRGFFLSTSSEESLNEQIRWVRGASPFSAARKKEIAGAIDVFAKRFRDDREGREVGKEAAKSSTGMWWKLGLPTTLITIYSVLIGSGKAGRINAILSLLPVLGYHLARAPFRGLRPLGEAWTRLRMRIEGGDLAGTYNDRTRELRGRPPQPLQDLSPGLRETVQEVRAGFNRGDFPHVLLSGASGGGKDHAALVTGQIAIEGGLRLEIFEGLNGVRYVEVSAQEIIAKAGAWANRTQEFFNKIFESFRSRPTILHFVEADKLGEAGYGGGTQSLNLLPDLYRILEDPRNENIRVILSSTRPQTILEKARDLYRRLTKVEIIPPRPEDVLKALRHRISSHQHGRNRRMSERFTRVQFSEEALRAVVALGTHEDGAPPSCHIRLLESLAERADTVTPSGQTVTVQEGNVVGEVADLKGKSPVEVRQELSEVLQGRGVEGNAEIQGRLTDKYYEHFTPLKGRVDPRTVGYIPPDPQAMARQWVDEGNGAATGGNRGGNGTPTAGRTGTDPARAAEWLMDMLFPGDRNNRGNGGAQPPAATGGSPRAGGRTRPGKGAGGPKRAGGTRKPVGSGRRISQVAISDPNAAEANRAVVSGVKGVAVLSLPGVLEDLGLLTSGNRQIADLGLLGAFLASEGRMFIPHMAVIMPAFEVGKAVVGSAIDVGLRMAGLNGEGRLAKAARTVGGVAGGVGAAALFTKAVGGPKVVHAAAGDLVHRLGNITASMERAVASTASRLSGLASRAIPAIGNMARQAVPVVRGAARAAPLVGGAIVFSMQHPAEAAGPTRREHINPTTGKPWQEHRPYHPDLGERILDAGLCVATFGFYCGNGAW